MHIEAQERFIRRELFEFQRNGISTPSDLNRDVEQVLEMIHQLLFDVALNVNEVKRRCGIRNNNISLHFRRQLGVGIHEYIEHQRTSAAKRLLANEDLEIFVIGWAVGYEHPESFTRAFRRHEGCPPSVFRERMFRNNVKKNCREQTSGG